MNAVTVVPGIGNQADFYFSAPVIVIADFTTDIWIEIPGFGPEYPLVSQQMAADVVRFTFGDEGIESGLPWEVTNVPSNLDLNGATMPVPQNGLVG